MAFGFRSSKGGSSSARAQRARKGHSKRRGRVLAVAPGSSRAHYRGSQHGRAKGSWLI